MAAKKSKSKSPPDSPSSPAAAAPGAPFYENWPPGLRYRLLLKLLQAHRAGARDPELLYLGARLAISLGLEESGRAFLAPLGQMLRGESGPSEAFFPVGLLSLLTSAGGQERQEILRDLRSLAGRPRLARALALLGLEEDSSDGSARPLLPPSGLLDPLPRAGGDGSVPPLAETDPRARLARQAYLDLDLAEARRQLEAMLAEGNRDQAVPRNLVIVCAEQEDIEAYERYWRRFVSLQLGRLLAGGGSLEPYQQLLSFYGRVAQSTDFDLAQAKGQEKETLTRPGLLPRWLEAHGALCWLEPLLLDATAHAFQYPAGSDGSAKEALLSCARLGVASFWLACFYPQFSRWLSGPVQVKESGPAPQLVFAGMAGHDPVGCLLEHFVDWSKADFYLGAQESDDQHQETVSALCGLAARLPIHAYAKQLQERFAQEEPTSKPFRRHMQEACGKGLWLRLGGLLQSEDWEGVVEYLYDGPAQQWLSPEMRLYAALALCRCQRLDQGLACAVEALADLGKEEEPSENLQNMFINVVHANLFSAFDKLEPLPLESAGEDFAPDAELYTLHCREFFAAILKPWHDMPPRPVLDAMRGRVQAAEEEALEQLLLRRRVDWSIAVSQRLAAGGRFGDARRIIEQLPDQPQDLARLKAQLLSGISQAQEQSAVQQRIERAMERSKEHVARGDFAQARDVINGLPDHPSGLAQMKRDLLDQIAQVERQARQADEIRRQFEQGVERIKRLVSQGDFAGARRVARELPEDYQFAEAKRSILQQIDQAEQDARQMASLKSQADAAMEQIRQMVGRGDFQAARQVARGLPDAPQLAEMKRGLAAQIEELAKEHAQKSRENEEMLNRLRGLNVDMAKLGQAMSDNQVDVNNPFHLNAFLKAVERQIRG